jgi:hypothetical protein
LRWKLEFPDRFEATKQQVYCQQYLLCKVTNS